MWFPLFLKENWFLWRAATSECKRELADLACKSENDKLYPTVLPNYCPGNSGNEQKKQGTYLGCYRDEFDARIFQGSFARLADNSRFVKFWRQSLVRLVNPPVSLLNKLLKNILKEANW